MHISPGDYSIDGLSILFYEHHSHGQRQAHSWSLNCGVARLHWHYITWGSRHCWGSLWLPSTLTRLVCQCRSQPSGDGTATGLGAGALPSLILQNLYTYGLQFFQFIQPLSKCCVLLQDTIGWEAIRRFNSPSPEVAEYGHWCCAVGLPSIQPLLSCSCVEHGRQTSTFTMFLMR